MLFELCKIWFKIKSPVTKNIIYRVIRNIDFNSNLIVLVKILKE